MIDRAYLRDALVASDPDLGRLRLAGRATLAALAATVVLDQLAQAIHQPTAVALVGIAMAMMGSVVVNDPAPRDQKITMALVPVVASVVVVAGTLVSLSAWLRAVVCLAIVFVAVLVRRFGPRGMALGMIAFLAYFNAIFFHARLAQLPLMIGGIFVASALAYGVRFWIVRERPAAILRRRLSALRRTIAMALFHLAGVAADGRWSKRRLRAVQRAMGTVNESALAIEELSERLDPAALAPSGGAPELRARIFALELAAERVAAAVEHLARSEGIAQPARDGVARALAAARLFVRTGDAAAEEQARRAIEAASGHAGSGDVKASHPLVRARVTVEDLLEAARWTFRPALAAPLAGEPAAPGDAAGVARSREPGAPARARATGAMGGSALRPAVQATVAAGLALVAGQAVSSTRGYWAVLAAFVVFTRATTLGATLLRAWQRVLGTVAGVIVGLFLAHAVQGHAYIELSLLFGCMFVAYYTLQVAQAWMVASMTTLVAVLYSLLGLFSPELLYLRVIETLIGAGAGALVAALVFPATTREKVREAMADALRMLGDYLHDAIVERPAGGSDLLGSARDLDRKLREVRSDVQPVAVGPLRPSREMARAFVAFSAVLFYARPLVAAEWLASTRPARSRVRDAGVRLAANARAVADVLEGRDGEAVTPTLPHIEGARRALTPDEFRRRGGGSPSAALDWLALLDEALLVLDRVVRETGLARSRRARNGSAGEHRRR